MTFYGQARIPREPGHPIHESPRAMTVPLVFLAVFSALAGYLGLPAIFGEKANLFGLFMEGSVNTVVHHLAASGEWLLVALATAAALLGIVLAFVLYRKTPALPGRLVSRFPGIYRLLVGKYYLDEVYDAVVVRPLVRGAERVYERFDLKVIDGALDGSAAAAGLAGRGLNILQNGLVRDYALAFLIGAILFLGFLLL
jgi:NADH-quinone oxidoreductase subunit L